MGRNMHKTSEYVDALWLSQFILKRIKEELTMDNMNYTRHQLLDSQVKYFAYMNSLFNFPEEEFKLRFDFFLKERFNHWLAIGKKMLQLGVFDSEILQRLRAVKSEVLREHYINGNEVEIHPSADGALVDAFCKEAQEQGFKINPRLQEAEMLSRLNAEFIKLGKKRVQYSPDMIAETPKLDPRESIEFSHLIKNLCEFRNFSRKAERNLKVKREHHLQLKVCIDNFMKSKINDVGLSGRQQYETSTNLLLSVFGEEFLVTEFTGKEVIKFKNVVLEMKSGRYIKGIEQTLSKKSVNKYLSNVRQFFQWLINEPKYLKSNPFSGVSMKLKAKDQKKRRAFTRDEVELLKTYKPSGKKEAKDIRNAANWFVKIALYTGMRLNEIASLAVREVRESEGIHYLDLSLLNGKNDNAPRIVPIHSKIIEMGFLGYVKEQETLGEERLFPELVLDSESAIRDGPGIQVGKWFNKTMLAKIGINKKSELDSGIMIDFHCARHTVASRFKYHGVDGYIAKQILGHHQEDEITWGTYSGRQGTKLSALKRVIEYLDY
ncbi:hypothetical protein BM528_08115 [Alteromonas sp. RW2A1]|nr:hypothetical protein BM528_08115 [Alteromonas sp. RW2A1]